MRFEKIIPTAVLRPYVKYFAVSEAVAESIYPVYPSVGLVAGFQYQGQLSVIKNGNTTSLSAAGITGMADRLLQFKNTAATGTILVYFTETGLAAFTRCPANELFNQSVSLEFIFDKSSVQSIEEQLALATTDVQRIHATERFLLSHLRTIRQDQWIIEAVKLIGQSAGTIRIKTLGEKLFISQSPLEKRFRKLVGTTPKKFASVIRFNAVLEQLNRSTSLTYICYENNFFDQAHFIRDFKQYTGQTPEQFKQQL
jgi:AraC-like DNA-binding protein